MADLLSCQILNRIRPNRNGVKVITGRYVMSAAASSFDTSQIERRMRRCYDIHFNPAMGAALDSCYLVVWTSGATNSGVAWVAGAGSNTGAATSNFNYGNSVQLSGTYTAFGL